MVAAVQFVIAVCLVLALVPPLPAARADEPVRACLDQKQRRAEAEAGKLIPLATAMHAARNKMPGTVVRARFMPRRRRASSIC